MTKDCVEPAVRLPASVCDLERPLVRRRAGLRGLLALDAEDRWGRPDAERTAAMDREARELRAAITEAEAEVARRVAELRTTDPELLEAWIAAQEALLEAFEAELDRAPDPDRVRTERHVARQEREDWGKVRAGRLAFVDQNDFYVRVPRALYHALFGFEP